MDATHTPPFTRLARAPQDPRGFRAGGGTLLGANGQKSRG